MNSNLRAAFSVVALMVVMTCPAQAAEPVCVTANKARLRKGPGEKHPVGWTVAQNMPLLKVSQKGSWAEVKDLDGQTHWIFSSSISGRASCAVIKSKSAPLRSGPGASHPYAEMSLADRYTPFKKIGREGAWVLLQDDYRGKFWVYETNLWIPTNRTSVVF